MSGEPALDNLCSLKLIVDFLGGGTYPAMQELLTGRRCMTLPECEDDRAQCVNAVLNQLPQLEQPYRDEVFETEAGRQQWLDDHPDMEHLVWIDPITTPPYVLRHAAAGLDR